VSFLTTLAGYVHWQLTGQKVLGIGDASGMFPVDPDTLDYDAARLSTFDDHLGDALPDGGLRSLLPQVITAGRPAGELTERGAGLLDPTGTLRPGSPMCPPEAMPAPAWWRRT